MNLEEFKQQVWQRSSFREKLWWVYLSGVFAIRHYFRRITKICPHDATTGWVDSKKQFCLDCFQEVELND